jgi:hypothetical protein
LTSIGEGHNFVILHPLERTHQSKNFLRVLGAILIIWFIVLVILNPWDEAVIVFFIILMTCCLIGVVILEYLSQFKSMNEFKIFETGIEFKTYYLKKKFVSKDYIQSIEIHRRKKEAEDSNSPDPYDGQDLQLIMFLCKDGSRFTTGFKIGGEIRSAVEFIEANWGVQITHS